MNFSEYGKERALELVRENLNEGYNGHWGYGEELDKASVEFLDEILRLLESKESKDRFETPYYIFKKEDTVCVVYRKESNGTDTTWDAFALRGRSLEQAAKEWME